MSRLRVLVVLVAAFVVAGLVAPAGAQAASRELPLRAAGSAEFVSGAGNCCGTVMTWAGTLRGPHVSKSTFTVEMSYGSFSPTDPSHPQRLAMEITARDGSVLVIEGLNDYTTPERTWQVVTARSTGRYAGWSGGGTYWTNKDYGDYGFDVNDPEFRIRLTGLLQAA